MKKYLIFSLILCFFPLQNLFCQVDSLLKMNDDWSEDIQLSLNGNFKADEDNSQSLLIKHLMNTPELRKFNQDDYLRELIYESIKNNQLKVYRDSFFELNNDSAFLELIDDSLGPGLNGVGTVVKFVISYIHSWEIKFNLSYNKNGSFNIKNPCIMAYLGKYDGDGNFVEKHPLFYFPLGSDRYDINSNDIIFVKHFRSNSKNYHAINQSNFKNQELVRSMFKRFVESEDMEFCLDFPYHGELYSSDRGKKEVNSKYLSFEKYYFTNENEKVDNLLLHFNLAWNNKSHRLYFNLSHVGLGTKYDNGYVAPLFFQKID